MGTTPLCPRCGTIDYVVLGGTCPDCWVCYACYVEFHESKKPNPLISFGIQTWEGPRPRDYGHRGS